MTHAPNKPFLIKDPVLIIGEEGDTEVDPATDPDYALALDTAEIVPSSSVQTWSGFQGASFTDSTDPTWALKLAGTQDWESAGSLCGLLYDHAGETRPYLLRSRVGGPGFKGQLILSATGALGAKNAPAKFDVTCGLTGKPVRVVAG